MRRVGRLDAAEKGLAQDQTNVANRGELPCQWLMTGRQ